MKFEHIVSNPGVLGGKPVIRNTRISVDFILELIASGGSINAVVSAYPQLSEDAVKEALNFRQN
ncbi:MAG: hypothetical protein RLZZ367_1252 [Bacteroidota bacterium]|jgi:uncharacterized protein (DUF433 family)